MQRTSIFGSLKEIAKELIADCDSPDTDDDWLQARNHTSIQPKSQLGELSGFHPMRTGNLKVSCYTFWLKGADGETYSFFVEPFFKNPVITMADTLSLKELRESLHNNGKRVYAHGTSGFPLYIEDKSIYFEPSALLHKVCWYSENICIDELSWENMRLYVCHNKQNNTYETLDRAGLLTRFPDAECFTS